MATTTDQTAAPSHPLPVGERPFEDHLPGIMAKRIWSDEAQDRRVIVTRLGAGASIPSHRHRGDELVFIVEGMMEDESGPLRAGQVGYRPNGCEHTVRTEQGATALVFLNGEIAPIDRVADGPPSQVIDVADLEWQPHRDGIDAKQIWNDPDGAERKLLMIRFEPGATIPAHRHVGNELVYVIEGRVEDDFGSIAPGEMSYRPDGCTHTVTSPRGATALVLITGHTDPL